MGLTSLPLASYCIPIFGILCFLGIRGAGHIKRPRLLDWVSLPDNQYKYAYQLPGDMLSGVRALFADSSTDQAPVRYGWEIYGDQLYTNLETVYIDYQSTVLEDKMPAYFVRLLRTALAAELGIVVTDQLSKTDYFTALSFGTPGENGRGGLFREAMNVDSRGNPPQVIEDYSLIDVRG